MTGGVFTSQGRTQLATILSMFVELPMTLGSVAFCVFILKMGLVPVYWCQAGVFWLEMAICLTIFLRSDWPKLARDVKVRQERAPSTAKNSTVGPPSIGFATPGAQKELAEFAASSPETLPTTS